ASRLVGVFRGHFDQWPVYLVPGAGRGGTLAVREALLKDAARVASVPVVGVKLVRYQLRIGALLKIDRLRKRFGTPVTNLVNPAVAAVPGLDVAADVARLLVVPVDQVDVAVGSVAEVDEARPGVVGQEEVGPVRGDVA